MYVTFIDYYKKDTEEAMLCCFELRIYTIVKCIFSVLNAFTNAEEKWLQCKCCIEVHTDAAEQMIGCHSRVMATFRGVIHPNVITANCLFASRGTCFQTHVTRTLEVTS